MIGKIISHYKILEKLGEGGMGIVYKAEDTKLERTVAIKFLPHHISANSEERQRFKIEAKAAAALNHPNIATIYAIEEFDKEMFIVMEYIDGVELKNKIKSGPISVEETINIVTQIAEGLEAAHKKGIVHRDIKSSNIMITKDCKVKIMDFGLAKIKGGTELTKIGTTLGTTSYMSPEQAKGEVADQRSDIWSFGIVMYEMLTGQLPFKGDYEQAVIYSILNGEPDSISEELPDTLKMILQKSLVKDLNDRYQHIDRVLTDLKLYNAGVKAYTISSTNDVKAFDVRRHKLYMAVGLILILIVVSTFVVKDLLTDYYESVNTLAILPFENQNADQEFEYLSDGIPESMIFKLSRLPGLKIRSLSSVSRYKGIPFDILEVGDDLDVQAVLTGRVSLRGDNLAVVVELVDTRDNTTIWGNTYRRNLADLLTVQEEITDDILSHLQVELTSKERLAVNQRNTDNSEAYQAYLKGRYFAHKRTEDGFRKALDYYQQAINIDPRYALAYSGIADTYFLLSIYSFMSVVEASPKAREAARAALRIDNTLAEAHLSMATVYNYFSWEWVLAEQEYNKAIQLNPNYANSYHHYGYFLSYLGRHPEAIKVAKTALKLEPLSSVMNRGLGIVYFLAREYNKATTFLNRGLELNPNSISALYYLIQTHFNLNQFDESIAMAERFMIVSGDDDGAKAMRQDYENLGYEAAILSVVHSKKIAFLSDPGFRAFLLGVIDEKEECLELLQQGIEQKSGSLAAIKVYPSLDGIRTDPRFVALIEKMPGFEVNVKKGRNGR